MIDTTHLRTLRLDRGYSIRRLAKAAGVDHQTIRRLENGADPGDLPLRVLNRLATALGVHPAALLASSDPGPGPGEGGTLQKQLGGAILAAPGTTITNLAAAADASIDDVKVALPALRAALEAAGLTLTQDGDALRITSRALCSMMSADTRPMTVNEARLLRRIHRGEDVRRSLSKADRALTLPWLLRIGLVNAAAPIPTVRAEICCHPYVGAED